MKKRLIALCMAMCMIAALLFQGEGMTYSSADVVNAAEAYDGYLYFTVEKSTLGQGLVVEPVKVGYYSNENLAAVTERVLAGKTTYSGTVEDGYYITCIEDGGEPDGYTLDSIPQIIRSKLESVGTRADKNKLGEYDYSSYAGWTTALNDKGLSMGASSYVPKTDADENSYVFEDGDVVRIQFSLYGWGQDTNAYWTDDTLIDFPSKDGLIKAAADYQKKTDASYRTAVEVIADWDATEDEIAAAYMSLSDSTATPSEPENTVGDEYKKALDDASGFLHQNIKNPTTSSVGGDWAVLGLARYGVEDVKWYGTYYENVCSYVKKKGSSKLSISKSTDNSRVVIALTSIGANPAEIEGYNLISPLADMDYVVRQGINGAIFALIALDSGKYEIPAVSDASITHTTRDGLVEYILNRELENGGWGLKEEADVDVTAIAIQALAPYYEKNADVKAAVDKSLDLLSDMQISDGTFGYSSSTNQEKESNCESTAQVVAALCSLGINPETDKRFVKSGSSALDGLMSFYDEVTKSFCHTTKSDFMATEQAVYALVAYDRLKMGKGGLYDMSDAKVIYEKADEEKPMPVIKAPSAPKKVKTKNVSDGVRLTWSRVKGATGYKVLRRSGSSKKWTTVAVIKKGKAVSYTDKKVRNGRKYTYAVQTVSKDGVSKNKTTVTYRLSRGSITAAGKTGTTIKVSWKKNKKASGYVVQYSKNASFKNAKTKVYRGRNIKSARIKTGKGYKYVRVRSYKRVSGKTYYGAWSAGKKAALKK